MTQTITQAKVSTQAAIKPGQMVEEIALFNAAGSPYSGRDATYDVITVGTVIGTATKTTTAAEPKAGSIVPIKFTNGNSAETPTINFNGAGARAIKLGGTASTAAKFTLAANGVAMFFFDGTILHQMGVYS